MNQSKNRVITHEEVKDKFIEKNIKARETHDLAEGQTEVKGSNTNIIMVTNKCNFDCTYCFEHRNIKPEDEFIISKKKIRDIVDKIYQENPDNSCIVIFGGEPLIAWNEIEYLMDYTKKYSTGIYFTMNTNGYRFKSQKFFNRYISNSFVKEHKISPEISFDGIGNFNRVTKAHKNTTNDLINILIKFRDNNVPFRISYTIHSGNEDKCAEDIKNIVKVFKPQRVCINVAWNDLKNHTVDGMWDKLHAELGNFKYKNIHICPIHCNTCTECRLTHEKYKYYNVDNNDDIYVKNACDVTGDII